MNCYCDEFGKCGPCINAEAINEMMMDHFDYEPSPYDGTYSEM